MLNTPEEWYQEILEAREQHFKEERIKRMNKAAQLFRSGSCESEFANKFLEEQIEELGAWGMKINMIHPIIENFVSQIVPEEIRASVLPKRPGGDKAAHNVQLLFNNDIIPNTEFNFHADRAAWNAAIFGDAFLKIGYVSAAKRSDVFDEEDLRATNPDWATQLGGSFAADEETQYRGDTVWFQCVHSGNIVPAPGSLSLYDTPYLIHKVRRRIEHVVADGNYVKKVRQNLNAITCDPLNAGNEYHYSAWTSQPEDDDSTGQYAGEYVDILEIWDLHNRRFLVISPGNLDGYLLESDWPFENLEGYPFVHLTFKRDPQGFFGIPMISDIADLQEELNTVSAFMVESYKRSVPVSLVDGTRVNDKQMQMLADSVLHQFVKLDGNPKDLITTFPQSGGSFSPDVYGVRNMIMQAMMLITGMTDFMMGQSQKTKSATETAATVQGFSTRMKYKSKVFRWFLRDALQKAYQIMRGRMDQRRWVRIVGAEGIEMIPVTPDQLREELDVDIDAQIFDDRLADPVRTKLILDAMAPLITNMPMLQLSQVNIPEMLRRYLQAIGEKEIDKLLPAVSKPKDPEIENLLMSEGQEVEVHPMDDDVSHMQSHIAFQQMVQQGSGPFMLAEAHVKRHGEMYQMKRQLAAQRDQAMTGGGGQGGGIEAPSRRTTPSAGEQTARTQQVVNQ